MTVLLDTHAVLFAALRPDKLSPQAAAIIKDPLNVLYVSALSAWEVSNKVRIGKLPHAEIFERDFSLNMNKAGYTMLPLTTEAALRAGRLIGTHRDPFDRLIAAQALSLDIPILSTDAMLDQFGVRRIW